MGLNTFKGSRFSPDANAVFQMATKDFELYEDLSAQTFVDKLTNYISVFQAD
ncbi:hypothetical protein KAR50_05820 [Periweissella fabaria]|uniref:Uncharacterized protein n=1 Tax=Periweissella fabaria TaxID=546157 RepID=A0ABN8BL73_9LACO|nr:hypothetical protein [Periweissella fabaria]MCM0597357.1 hypothetical protein [Periweissella fabaria]CAH0416137.1 hypothetical protein WFA24289_00436 [Periweissella fabaria]